MNILAIETTGASASVAIINEEGKEKALEILSEGQVRDAYRFIFNDWAPHRYTKEDVINSLLRHKNHERNI